MKKCIRSITAKLLSDSPHLWSIVCQEIFQFPNIHTLNVDEINFKYVKFICKIDSSLLKKLNEIVKSEDQCFEW